MSSKIVNNSGTFATALYNFCIQPTVGLDPIGFKSGRVLFGPTSVAFGAKKTLAALEGSPRSVFFAEEPDTLRWIIDGESLISREKSERGLFREIHRIEGLLNSNPRDIFEAAGPKSLGLEQFRPGFPARLDAYSAICLRDIIRGSRPDSAAGTKGAAELAADVTFAATQPEGTTFDRAEIMLMAGALFASLGNMFAESAVNAFVDAFIYFIGKERDNAALIAADLAAHKAGGFQPNFKGKTLGRMIAISSRNAAQGYASTDPVGTMIARHRGISAALATGSWDDAGTLFRLDADASTGLDRAHGLIRSAWAFTRWEMAEGANERWPQIAWLLKTAGSMMEDIPEKTEEGREMFALGNIAASWVTD